MSDLNYHLNSERFTTHQPSVLEQIGAHHAYATGLTGLGVRIGIEDTVVDYTQRAEFGDRVKLNEAEGAKLLIQHPYGDDPFSDIQRCQRFRTCSIWRRNSEGDEEAHNRWAREVVSRDGWPIRDDMTFVLDEHYSEFDQIASLYRWWEVPTPYGEGAHGTIVASVAAGTRLGVAPGATLIPVVRDFSDDQRAIIYADAQLQELVSLLPDTNRRQFDDALANVYSDHYSKFDIINRSYGTPLFDTNIVASEIDLTLQWYRRYLPKALNAILQAGTPDSQKTILVYAAGNESQMRPGLSGSFPFYIPELRGHSLTVVATDPDTRLIAGYSNRCGRIPSDWDTARFGRHYCLAAPGTVRGLNPNPAAPGSGTIKSDLRGTSYAAPLVSGALALLKEHFRGVRGNTQIVKRIIDTANRSGQYADVETYGAGHLDLAAALAPVGTLEAGFSEQALSHTALQTPSAFGPVAQRVGNIELAAFDAQNFPFWVPLSSLVSTHSAIRSPVPELTDSMLTYPPAPGLETLGLHWVNLEHENSWPFRSRDRRWLVGLGQSSFSLAQRPQAGHWGYGFNWDRAGYLGSRTSGAFGSDLSSRMIWTTRILEKQLNDTWAVHAKGTLAYSLSEYENQAIFSASPTLMSALMLRIGTSHTGFTVEQPLFAETGTGTFRVENGRLENGHRLYDVYQVPLRPDARELRMALRHDQASLGGKVALEISHSMHVGHVRGSSASGIGLAYQRTW